MEVDDVEVDNVEVDNMEVDDVEVNDVEVDNVVVDAVEVDEKTSRRLETVSSSCRSTLFKDWGTEKVRCACKRS
jgi:LSD1 subclass zinc finger protein